MPYVFEVTDQTGRRIHLSQERWSHIVRKHPEMADKLEDVQNSLQKPTFIVSQAFDKEKANYYL